MRTKHLSALAILVITCSIACQQRTLREDLKPVLADYARRQLNPMHETLDKMLIDAADTIREKADSIYELRVLRMVPGTASTRERKLDSILKTNSLDSVRVTGYRAMFQVVSHHEQTSSRELGTFMVRLNPDKKIIEDRFIPARPRH